MLKFFIFNKYFIKKYNCIKKNNKKYEDLPKTFALSSATNDEVNVTKSTLYIIKFIFNFLKIRYKKKIDKDEVIKLAILP